MNISPHGRRLGVLARTAIFALLLPLAPLALAETQGPPSNETIGRDDKGQRERDLEALRQAQQRAAEAEASLKAEIEAISEDRGKLSNALIETAANIRALEARSAASEGRLKTLDENDRTIRRSLDERRTVIAEVLAARQRIGRKPPPAWLVRPEHALQSVRTAMMFGAVVPALRIESEALVADLAELVRVRNETTAELEASSRDLAALSQDRQ